MSAAARTLAELPGIVYWRAMRFPPASPLYRRPLYRLRLWMLPVVTALLVVFACQGVSWGLPRKNVLLLHNLNQDHPAIAEFDLGLRETLLASQRFDVRLSAEYVNMTSLEGMPSYVEETARYLRMKYGHWKPDAVYADKAVTPMVARFMSEAFEGLPLFVSQDRYVADKAFKPNVLPFAWGMTDADIQKNFELVVRLLPDVRRILVVLGASVEEKRLGNGVAAAAARLAGTLTVETTTDLSCAAMLERVSATTGPTAIVFLRFGLGADGQSHVPAQVARLVQERASVPVFTVARHLLGEGSLGGYCQNLKLAGQQVGRWLLDALDGREPRDKAATIGFDGYAFDWRALKRWGIPESALPAGSEILFREEGIWQRHKFYIVSGIVLLAAETFLILGLVVNRLRRRRAEAALLALNATLEARVMERTRELHEANAELHDAKAELEVLNHSLAQLARTDSLTGLPNRRHAEEALQEALVRFCRYRAGQVFAVALADIDFFKRINDQHGHEAGDDLLREVARVMAAGVRECDLVARWGGEEFLLLLPGTDLNGAGRLLERIREGIEMSALRCGAARASVTLTIGVAVSRCGDSAEDVVRRADSAMYRGKAGGRNQVVLEEAGPEETRAGPE